MRVTKKFRILFFLTFILSCFIRFYYLTQNPEGFDQTEASFGYNAYSVLKTGRDEFGKFLPLVITSFGDYKLAGYMYWQIPFIAIFGLSEFSTRLSTAVSGIITLFLVYYIVYEFSKDKKLALLMFLITSITPWHIILSRMAYDPMIALMFCLASIAAFIKWQKKQRLYFLLFSALTLSLGIMTYYAVWVILPVFIITYWIIILKNRSGKSSLWLTTAIILLPLLMITRLLFITQGQRLYQDSTFQVNAYPLLEEQIREDQHDFPLLVTRAFHNKAMFYPQILLQNFSNNLSFTFLFLTGDKMDRRFFVPFQGVLFLWSVPFVLLGILYFWKHYSSIKNLLILSAIFIIFLGSSFSEFGSEAERTIFAIPLFCFLICYGLLTVYRKIHHKLISRIFLVIIGFLLSANVAYFNHQYYWHANVHEPWGRNFGMREMLANVASLENKYNKIIIPDEAVVFYYFFNKVDPAIAWTEAANRLNQANFIGFYQRSKVGNYLTMSIECPPLGKLNVLYVCRGRKIPKNSKIINIIRRRDNIPAFILLEFTLDKSKDPLPVNIEYMDKYGILSADNEAYW